MFDNYVAQTRPNWRRRAFIIGSIVLHVIVGIALVIYTLFHVEEIAPPAVSLTFFSAPPPPPPPKGSKKKAETPKTQPQPKIEVPKTSKIVQPTEKPPENKPPETKPVEEPEGDEDGEEGGEKGGVKGGVKGGTKGGEVGGTGGGEGKPAPIPRMTAAFILATQQLQHPEPHLPDWFKNQHANQVVKGNYKVCLRTDGHVSDVYPQPGIAGVDVDVINQIKGGWVYKSQPVPVCFIANVQFRVN